MASGPTLDGVCLRDGGPHRSPAPLGEEAGPRVPGALPHDPAGVAPQGRAHGRHGLVDLLVPGRLGGRAPGAQEAST